MPSGIECKFASRSAPGDKQTSGQLCPGDTVMPNRNHFSMVTKSAPRDHMQGTKDLATNVLKLIGHRTQIMTTILTSLLS